jgi:hypothetical protein
MSMYFLRFSSSLENGGIFFATSFSRKEDSAAI